VCTVAVTLPRRARSARIAQRTSRSSLTDELADAIVDFVGASQLSRGDRLPSVRALAERFEVAAPTVREALRRLEAEGIVVLRHGSGVYVSGDAARRVIGNPHAPVADPVTCLELLETRLLLEPTAAELGCLRGPSVELDVAAHLLRVAATQLEEPTALSTTNVAFHVAVARQSGNSVLAQTVDALLVGHRAEQEEILATYEDSRRDHEDHTAILEAIVGGDAGAAYAEMFRHLVSVSEVVASRAPEDVDA
jgi:GntR family transcriptional repressor for pyruvate dehydrogenase complex